MLVLQQNRKAVTILAPRETVAKQSVISVIAAGMEAQAKPGNSWVVSSRIVAVKVPGFLCTTGL
jgi:hypothetical protein